MYLCPPIPPRENLLTRNLDPHAQEEGPFDADPTAMTDAHAKEDAFLVKLGYAK
jgi:hypothetical protein